VNEPDLEGFIGEIRTRLPHLKIIAAYPYDDPARRLLAMRAGANEFIHSPVGPALAAVFKRTIDSRHTARSRRATNLERTAVFVLPADCRIEKLHGVIEFLREHHDLVVLDFRTSP
jgi:DNA-binding NarL/FixJ family response regulator